MASKTGPAADVGEGAGERFRTHRGLIAVALLRGSGAGMRDDELIYGNRRNSVGGSKEHADLYSIRQAGRPCTPADVFAMQRRMRASCRHHRSRRLHGGHPPALRSGRFASACGPELAPARLARATPSSLIRHLASRRGQVAPRAQGHWSHGASQAGESFLRGSFGPLYPWATGRISQFTIMTVILNRKHRIQVAKPYERSQ
jgi:hypothetical protein